MSDDVHVPAVTPEVFARIRAAVRRLPQESGPLIDQAGYEPKPASIAAREVASAVDADGFKTAYSQGAVAIENAADHIFALDRACTEPVVAFATWTLARGALEASALATWLLDPNIGSPTRLSRSMSLRLDELRAQLPVLRVTAQSGGVQKVMSRIQEVADVAKQRGVPEKRNRRNQLVGFGAGMPSLTRLSADSLDAEYQYRLASAVAHGRLWALRSVGFNDVPHRPGFMEKHVPAEAIVGLSLNVLEWFPRAVWCEVVLLGWDRRPFARLFESLYDQAGLKAGLRFWRRTPNSY